MSATSLCMNSPVYFANMFTMSIVYFDIIFLYFCLLFDDIMSV